MRIIIDINHPAHVHYFRNFIQIMKGKGHEILCISRNKEIEFKLLNYYNINFVSRSKGSNGFIGKFLYTLKADILILKHALKFKPDIYLSFLHPYPAHVAFLTRKPSIVFSDTEHAKLHHALTIPFIKVILSPKCYKLDFGKKHLRFNGYMELCYLHPNRFKANPIANEILNLDKNEKYAIVRFVSWKAIHDVGHDGLSYQHKLNLIRLLTKYMKVFISSEGELPEDLRQHQIKIAPYQMHNVLANATLFVGEGATMASECAMLGTPAIFINPLSLSYLEEEEQKYGLVFNFRDSNGVSEKVEELLTIKNLREEFQKRRLQMLKEKIDMTAFMVWFIENWPDSVSKMSLDENFEAMFK